jgi:hypothetical protein
MTRRNPPAIATWVLRHLGRNEALEGDLLEEYKRGRSGPWYWGQVIAAISIGFAEGLRLRWPAVAFALLWSVMPLSYWRRLTVEWQAHSDRLMGYIFGLPWPYSTLCAIALSFGLSVAFLWVGLCLCLFFGALRRNVSATPGRAWAAG